MDEGVSGWEVVLKFGAKVRIFFDICKFLGLGKVSFSYICPKLPKMFQKKMSGLDPDARDKEEAKGKLPQICDRNEK